MTDTIEIPEGQQADGTVPEQEPEERQEQQPETDTFTREYVQELRDESAARRVQAREAQEAMEPLQQRLFAALVERTGLLADPSDLPFDAALLEDETALQAAVEGLIETKPHLASRRVGGDVGQGRTGTKDDFSLAGMMAGRA